MEANSYYLFLSRIFPLVISGFIFGCASQNTNETLWGKHLRVMDENPGKLHYVTAIPFDAYGASDELTAYQQACFIYRDEPKYNINVDKLRHTITWGGRSRGEAESYALNQCEIHYRETCIVVLYNEKNVCGHNIETTYARFIEQKTKKQILNTAVDTSETHSKSVEKERRLLNIGLIIMGAGAGLEAARNQNNEAREPTTQICTMRNQVMSGLNKICYYNCSHGIAAQTIKSAEICPPSMRK